MVVGFVLVLPVVLVLVFVFVFVLVTGPLPGATGTVRGLYMI